MAVALQGAQPLPPSSLPVSRSRWIIGLMMALLLLLSIVRDFHRADPDIEHKGLSARVQSHPEVATAARLEGDLNALRTGLTSYLLHTGALPTAAQGLHALTVRPTSAPVPAQYQRIMKMALTDPWGHEYRYHSPARRSDEKYDIYSMGADGIDGTADDRGNWKAGRP